MELEVASWSDARESAVTGRERVLGVAGSLGETTEGHLVCEKP